MYIHVHEADYSNIIKTACLKKKKRVNTMFPIPSTGSTPPHLCACPQSGNGFPTSYVTCSGSGGES